MLLFLLLFFYYNTICHPNCNFCNRKLNKSYYFSLKFFFDYTLFISLIVKSNIFSYYVFNSISTLANCFPQLIYLLTPFLYANIFQNRSYLTFFKMLLLHCGYYGYFSICVYNSLLTISRYIFINTTPLPYPFIFLKYLDFTPYLPLFSPKNTIHNKLTIIF